MAEAVEAIASDYVRVKRKMTTIFLYTTTATDTAGDLKAKINQIAKVPVTESLRTHEFGAVAFALDGKLFRAFHSELQAQDVLSWPA